MKKQLAAFGLLVLITAIGAVVASADGMICDLTVSTVKATSAEIVWNCTYKEDQTYILSYRIEGLERAAEQRTSQTYYRLSYLCPGTTYVLTVSTNNGGSSTVTFTTPYAVDYARYNYQLLDAGVYRSTAGRKDYAELASLSGKTLPGEVYDYDFSLMFQSSLTASEEDKSMHCTLELRLPNGDIYSTDELVWYTLKSATTEQYIPFTELLQDVLNDYGAFPAGTYTLTAYLNGSFAAETAIALE